MELRSRLGSVGMESLTGRTLSGRYRLEEQIGAGGMGQGVAGDRHGAGPAGRREDHVSTRPTPIRRPWSDLPVKRTTAGISHPHVVTVHDSGATDDLAYLVMELLPGPAWPTRW